MGCDMALDYVQNGKKVTVIEALPKILLAGIPSPIPKWYKANLLYIKINNSRYCAAASWT